MEKLYYKTHKKFFMLLKNVLFFTLKYLKIFLNVCGIKLLLKGKIALSGNSKKKKYLISMGNYSFTKKNTYVNYNKNTIKTISGMLGYSIFIFF